MARSLGWIAIGTVACMAGLAAAQPAITSLGSGTPSSVTNNLSGSFFVGGSGMQTTAADRWTLSGSTLSAVELGGSGGGLVSADGQYAIVLLPNSNPRVFGNTATGVSPAFSTTPTLVPSTANPQATELRAARWSMATGQITPLGGLPVTPSLMVYGSGSNGSSSGNFLNANAISANGRFIVGMGYISSYNSAAGTTISDSTSTWRPWIWDAQANGGAGGFTVLSTPFRTSSNTWRRRTGQAYAVSADGTVVVGVQEHNVAAAAAADPDGCRLIVWRWNAGTSNYDMSFLPNGLNAAGLVQTYTISPGNTFINQAGTVIVGKAVDSTGATFVGKWTWDAGSSTWSQPVNLASNLSTPASWLPSVVTSCAVPPTLNPTGMSDDGNTVVGSAVYSTCGGFMSGGFIWTNNDGGSARDWYDYLVAQNTPGVTDNYGPIGDNGDPTRGLCKLGFPSGISADGSTIVGLQGGSTLIPGSPSWIVNLSGGPSCVAPLVTRNPANEMYTRCSFGTTVSFISLSTFAAGTQGFGYQWTLNGNPLSDGTTAWGSVVTGSNTFQLRVNVPGPNDAGTYACTITGCNGSSATTSGATVQTDPSVVTPPNDTCATAQAVGEGTFNFNICGAYVNDGASGCTTGTEFGDVWYSYTPTFTGDARFQTCGSTFDTNLTVLDGCNGSVLDCNNDVGVRGVTGVTCSSNRSLISRLHVTAGTPVIVRVGALSTPFSNSPTSGALTISQAPPIPANDLCMNATAVTLGTYPFDLSEATDDYNFGVDGCGGGTQTASNRDVWFRLISPFGGTYTISTCGSTITNPMLHVLSDSCFAPQFIACNDNVGSGVTGCTSNQARVSNVVITGNVLIRVSNSGTGAPTPSGVGQITITGTPNSGCGSADFNCDGDIGTDADIESFFACLAGDCPVFPCESNADFNGDGDIGTDADIEAFFRVLAGGTC